MKTHGFSLIEMIIMILVIAIVALAVIPKLLDTGGIDALVAAETAATDIRAVQSLAMYTGTPRVIAFVNGDQDYLAGGLIPPNRTLPGNSVPGSSLTLSFNGFGEPNITDPTTLIFYSGGNSASLTIIPLTGMVTVN